MHCDILQIAPARGRELKRDIRNKAALYMGSPPRGGVN